MRRVALLAAAAAAVLPGGALAADETTQYQLNPQHTNAARDSPLEPPLRLRWRADLGTPAGQPLVAGGRVFYVREPGTGLQLTALDSGDGHVLWSQDASRGAAMAYDGGRLFTLSEIGEHGEAGVRVRALDPATGSVIWSRDVESEYGVGSYPTAADGQLFFLESSGGTTLYALRQSDGANLWPPKALSSGDDSTPALDADSVYVSLAGHQTYRFDRSTGELRWHSRGCCTGGGGTTPVLHGGRLYAEDNLVHDASDGLIVDRWPGYVLPSFSGDHGVEIVAGETLRGFGPAYDTTRWSFDPPGWAPGSRPLLARGHAYVSGGSSSSDGTDLVALRLEDGVPVWCVRPEQPPGPSSSIATPAVVPLAAGDGALLVKIGYGLGAFESGGEPTRCSEAQGGPPDPPAGGGTPSPPEPPVGEVSGPTLTMKVGRRRLFLGQRTQVVGRLSGLETVRGKRVALDLDDWPFDGRFRRAATARATGEGLVRFRVQPARNVQVRLRLLSDPAVTSAPQTVWADFRVRIERLGEGGPRPRLRVTIFAPRGAAIRRRVVHAYLRRGARGTRPWRRVGGRRWQRRRRLSATVTIRFPRGRLVRRDRVLVCIREPVPDGFGRPHPLDPRCGEPTLPRLPI